MTCGWYQSENLGNIYLQTRWKEKSFKRQSLCKGENIFYWNIIWTSIAPPSSKHLNWSSICMASKILTKKYDLYISSVTWSAKVYVSLRNQMLGEDLMTFNSKKQCYRRMPILPCSWVTTTPTSAVSNILLSGTSSEFIV